MRASAWLISLVLAGLAGPAAANDREALVKAYVERVVVNSLDQPDSYEPYFSEIRLLNDFSVNFVEAYTGALARARQRGDVTLFERDPLTGDANRCPIGMHTVRDLTRADTRIMVEARLDNSACNDGREGPRNGIRLMFFLVKDEKRGGAYVIDDITREAGEARWASIKAWLERR
ncbi:MAG: hypothetical protein KJ670_20170 [Alphaproteobacteria bacterium]|nr:hypothetical protein [Rhizobiaceae bacterium]MBU3960666.1 hypothetical protein [Alphaproteobacteria bacterium]MBU4049740.1 hypothetical protein [Alphaproteobacteria bacterium]MBU4091036.1 hypothetical protein [Alphaproteobacteria bacterium]MBU4155047.1 hypothetical protein [Alphaproteobacteria bacterium]